MFAQVRLYIPALRDNLQLRAGAQAVVNLTLNTLFESATWIPAERRKADEPSDDWKWTMRSAANRPILRMTEDGDVIMVSSSVTESQPKHTDRARAEMTAGDGGFGSSGVHNVFVLDRTLDDGGGLAVRADVGKQPGPTLIGPSTEVSAGYGTRLGFAGAGRAVVSYQTHPELVSSGGTPGLDAMQMSSAQLIKIGDLADVEAGGTFYVVRTAGYASGSRPFFKVTTHPIKDWTIGYRMATSQDLQSFAGLDSLQQALPVAAMYQGRMDGAGASPGDYGDSQDRAGTAASLVLSRFSGSRGGVRRRCAGTCGPAADAGRGEWDCCGFDDGELPVSERRVQDPGRECDPDGTAVFDIVVRGGVCDGQRAGGEGRGLH